jgi:hypothetical protein
MSSALRWKEALQLFFHIKRSMPSAQIAILNFGERGHLCSVSDLILI